VDPIVDVCPDGHGEHAIDANEAEKYPMEQLWQSNEPTDPTMLEYVPDGQLVQVAEPTFA